jgi:hypothetical protein
MILPWRFSPILPAAMVIAGCADAPPLEPPTVPPALQLPATHSLYLEARADGVQIYRCSRKSDATYEWAFNAPEARLSDRSGHPLGKHYAGPTWEALDGSTVVGETKARDAGPTTTAIPWLLLAAKSHAGSGTFTAANYVQRVATMGGAAPTQGCFESTLGQQARVPYSAVYYFYR